MVPGPGAISNAQTTLAIFTILVQRSQQARDCDWERLKAYQRVFSQPLSRTYPPAGSEAILDAPLGLVVSFRIGGSDAKFIFQKPLRGKFFRIRELLCAMYRPCIGEQNGTFRQEVSFVVVVFCEGVWNTASCDRAPAKSLCTIVSLSYRTKRKGSCFELLPTSFIVALK